MSENKNLILACFIFVLTVCAVVQMFSFLGSLREKRIQEWNEEFRQIGRKRIIEVSSGPEPARIQLTTNRILDIPENIRVIKTQRVSKYKYSIIIEGSKKEVIQFLSKYYGTDQN